MTDEEIRDIFGELRRIGVNMEQPPGLAIGGGFRDGDFLAWLRELPDGLGHEEFVQSLNRRMDAALPNVVPAPDPSNGPAPRRYCPTLEQLEAGVEVLLHEWDPLGARLGDLSRDDVAMLAFNALNDIVRQGPTRDVELRIATHFQRVERDDFGLRPSPLVQMQYLARRLMQVVAEHPGPPHEFDPLERKQRTAETAAQREAAIARRSGVRSARVSRNIVYLGPRGDEPAALDPNAICAECGATGTVAFVTRETEPHLSQYCADCWRRVRHNYWRWSFDQSDRQSPEALITTFERMYHQEREQPRGSGSALWEDQLGFVRAVLERNNEVQPADRERNLRRVAADLVSLAPRMQGPMPPELESFVREHPPTNA